MESFFQAFNFLMPYFDTTVDFIRANLVAIYFSLSAFFLFLLILFIDSRLQKSHSKNKADIKSRLSDEPAKDIKRDQSSEFEKGMKSLQRALDDNILTDEEFAKFEQELKDKYSAKK